MILTILVFLVLLSILVLIHELGHFVVAKKLGIKVEEFGFGFPPRVFGIKRGETLYSINALPIGGFVKLYGEDEAGGGRIGKANPSTSIANDQRPTTKDQIKRAFFARPAWQRATVVLAGVIMNMVLAIAIYYIFLFISNFKTELPLISDHRFFFVNQVNVTEVVIDKVVPNSPAEKAGITPLSKIISINNQEVRQTNDFVEIVNNNKGKEIIISWKDLKTQKEFSGRITPRTAPPKDEGALGVIFFPVTTARLSYESLSQKVFSGVVHPFNLLSYNLDLLGKLVSLSVKEKSAKPIGENVAGPVGIFSLVQIILQIPDIKEKVLQTLNLAGILSISLAFFNVLPIPALDGGRLFFILVEMGIRKKIPPKYESFTHTVGLALLLMLIILVTFQDIGRILSGGFR